MVQVIFVETKRNGCIMVCLGLYDASVVGGSQGRDMRVCLWDLSEGRSDVVDSVWTGSMGFCQCCTLEMSPGTHLLAFAGEQEEVRTFVKEIIKQMQTTGAKCTYSLFCGRTFLTETKIFIEETHYSQPL